MRYEVIEDEVVNLKVIKSISDDGVESFIPEDEANADYQAYLLSLKE